MTEAEKLAEAYFTLGMKPGGSKEAVNSRWKRLAMVWHSDRFTSEESKREADEELKNINNARDILKKHFETSHKASGPCACNTNSGAAGPSRQTTGTGQGPGPGKRRTTQETDREEAEAARRNKERADRAARAAAEQAAQEAQAKAAAAAEAERSKKQDEQTASAADEKLRWKIALCMAAAWLILNIFGFGATSVKHWWTDLTDKWQRDRHSEIDVRNAKKAADDAAAAQRKRDQDQGDADRKRLEAEDLERKNQAIASAKDAIKRQQDIIDHCTAELAKIQSQLDDPNVAYSEKIKLRGYQRQNQVWLSNAQASYNIAQQQLADATETPAPTPIGGVTDTPVPHVSKLFDLRPPLNITDIAPGTDQPPAQKFTEPHWNPNGLPTRPNDPLLPSLNK